VNSFPLLYIIICVRFLLDLDFPFICNLSRRYGLYVSWILSLEWRLLGANVYYEEDTPRWDLLCNLKRFGNETRRCLNKRPNDEDTPRELWITNSCPEASKKMKRWMEQLILWITNLPWRIIETWRYIILYYVICCSIIMNSPKKI
jgi:hypothetical protein